MRLNLTRVADRAVTHLTHGPVGTLNGPRHRTRHPIEVPGRGPLPYNPHSPGHPRLSPTGLFT